jgi:Leucine-rich repeat (LRR) protein
MGRMTSLYFLTLQLNDLIGSIPTELGFLKDIYTVALRGNYLSGPIPGTLTLLTGPPTYFRLDTNPGLCRLDAASTAVTNMCIGASLNDACPYPTCACKFLACPSGAVQPSSVNAATPFYPAEDPTCCPVGGDTLRERLVTDLHLDCSVGRPCVATTGTPGRGTLVSTLSLGTEGITGTIPPQLGELTALKVLNMRFNQLYGTVPSDIGKLTALTELRLAANVKISGSIPPEFGRLTALKYANLANNLLVGVIPPDVGALTVLSSLFLNNNRLTGTLPPEMGSMAALEAVNLLMNKLNGTLPPEFGSLLKLTQLNLRNNKLTGAIPSSLTLLTKTTSFRLDSNVGLCRLDAGSTTAANKCTPLACPYSTCECTILAACPSGATKSASASANPATPFYPADHATCCPTGSTLREQLVTDEHLDCSVGRPCVATTTGASFKGTNLVFL